MIFKEYRKDSLLLFLIISIIFFAVAIDTIISYPAIKFTASDFKLSIIASYGTASFFAIGVFLGIFLMRNDIEIGRKRKVKIPALITFLTIVFFLSATIIFGIVLSPL